ncbi:RHS repeat-associated core domain-containing protein [Pseudomonas sp. FP198]|uniref:RHS repeat-associated core domain-containing protein n=1 Tax=Pseudomonas sp. FP198 TaxID=2954084 RepID=UPI002735C839|nr:RHS repeat-associated core domain-containing protein [Pseudomonas sp. FP198]WLG94514.1 RHS repeat-associated core domain-containing protein [Pseudomonas sp. FP198]
MTGADKKERVTSGESITTVSTSSGEALVSFHYDGMDTLTGQSTANGREQRFYRNDELANEIRGAASSTFVKAEGMVLAEHQVGGDPRVLLLAGDGKGSVMSETSQAAISSMAYSPYGHRPDEAPMRSHLGYNGHRREAQSGWYLLGNGYRVFNPLLMRFHSPDSLSPFGTGGLNAYMYCVGDPINNVDPTGHSPWGWLLRGIRRISGSKRITTATPGYENLPGVLGRNTKSHATTLMPIQSKHVEQLEGIESSYKVVSKEPSFKQRMFSSEDLYLKHQQQLKSNTAARLFASENVGERGITREGAKMIKTQADRLNRSAANIRKDRSDRVMSDRLYKENKKAAADYRDGVRPDSDRFLRDAGR